MKKKFLLTFAGLLVATHLDASFTLLRKPFITAGDIALKHRAALTQNSFALSCVTLLQEKKEFINNACARAFLHFPQFFQTREQLKIETLLETPCAKRFLSTVGNILLTRKKLSEENTPVTNMHILSTVEALVKKNNTLYYHANAPFKIDPALVELWYMNEADTINSEQVLKNVCTKSHPHHPLLLTLKRPLADILTSDQEQTTELLTLQNALHQQAVATFFRHKTVEHFYKTLFFDNEYSEQETEREDLFLIEYLEALHELETSTISNFYVPTSKK